MRRWIGRLHGGQLTMVAIAVAGFGGLLVYIGNGLMARSSELGRALYAAKDTSAALSASVERDGTIGLRLWGAGILLWLVCVPLLWVWFGTRKKDG